MRLFIKKVVENIGNNIIQKEKKIEGKSSIPFLYEKDIPKEVLKFRSEK